MTIKHLIAFPFVALLSVLATVSVYAQTDVPYPTDTPVPSPTSAPVPTTVPTTAVTLPEVPQGVSAVAVSHERIDVSWKKAANATAYEVYRNNELVAIVGSLFYSDNGLTPETTYSYKVRSFDGSNYSQFSTTVSATSKSEGDKAPEPTIPGDPDVSERQPAVFDNFSFVMVGSERRDFESIGEFEAGEDFVIYGKTENYADIEIVVNSAQKSFYAKADDKGFWEAKIDTTDMTPGMHTFQIIISAESFPEKYESEEYLFEISETEADTIQEEEADSFGSKVSRIVLTILIIVIIAFAVLVFVAVKKGWFKKLLGKDTDKNVKTPDGQDHNTSSAEQNSLEQSIGDIASAVIEPDTADTAPKTESGVQAETQPEAEPETSPESTAQVAQDTSVTPQQTEQSDTPAAEEDLPTSDTGTEMTADSQVSPSVPDAETEESTNDLSETSDEVSADDTQEITMGAQDSEGETPESTQDETMVDSTFSEDSAVADSDLSDSLANTGADTEADTGVDEEQEGIAGDEEVPVVDLSSTDSTANESVVDTSSGTDTFSEGDEDSVPSFAASEPGLDSSQAAPSVEEIPDYSSVTEEKVGSASTADSGAEEMVVGSENTPDSEIGFSDAPAPTPDSETNE